MCPTCLQNIVTPNGQFCLRCGGRRFVLAGSAEDCFRCRTAQFRFQRAIVLGEYRNDLRWFILRMKTDRTGILAISAATVLANCRLSDLKSVGAEIIVPVPMHRVRRADRGNNSPDSIAEELGRRLNIPVAKHLVRRIHHTALQYTLSHRARADNVHGAFALHSPNFWETLVALARTAKSTGQKNKKTNRIADLSGKTVLLVDDILTSGATCNEVTKVLLAAGARSVTVAALARAEGKFIAAHRK